MPMKLIKVLLVCLFIVGTWKFLKFENNAIEVTPINLRQNTEISRKTPPIRIVHLSDLQCKQFGNKQQPLIQKIRESKPDLIVITGDLVDAFHYNDASWKELSDQLPSISPTYFVSGNHEWWAGNFKEVKQYLSDKNIHVLENDYALLKLKNRTFVITGLSDPAAYNGDTNEYKNRLKTLENTIPKASFSLLLAHRPEFFKRYDHSKFDLVLAGHAHGGQIRFPFIGGLFAPNQGVLPEYSAGLYQGKHTKMIVSRGLGNSVFPQRLFNRPEVIIVDI